MLDFNIDLPNIPARDVFWCQSSQVIEVRGQEPQPHQLSSLEEPFNYSTAEAHTAESNCENMSVFSSDNNPTNLQLFNGHLWNQQEGDFTDINPDQLEMVLEPLSINSVNGIPRYTFHNYSIDNQIIHQQLIASESEIIPTDIPPILPDALIAQDVEIEDKIPPLLPPTIDIEIPDSGVETPESPPEAPTETDTPEMETPEMEIPEMDWRKNSLESLQSTSERYPFIVNPSDRFTFPASIFRPFQDNYYSTVDLRFAEDNPILNKLTFAYFPQRDQLYWVLEGNRVVLETQGMQAGVVFQGRSTTRQFTQTIIPQQRFFGLQAIWSLPPTFDDLRGNNNDFAVLSVAGQINNPPGIPAGEVIIQSGINGDNENTVFLPRLGAATSNNPEGGGALFQNLDPENAPRFIQAFPTNNLRPLLNNEVSLAQGAIIPTENLAAAGLGFANINTGLGFNFAAPLTSVPGIKVGQPGGGMNIDLLNLVVNPFVSPRERDLRYLNSLFWFSLGQTIFGDTTQLDREENSDWYRFYFSLPHRKTTIEYDAEEITATYRSVFRNPGISVTTSFDKGIDDVQFFNATLGLLMGIFFAGIENEHIEEAIDEANTALENGEPFAILNTVATPLQRRAINQRLNQNLFNTERVTKLEQLSGSYAFPATISTNNSRILELRTGLYGRRVEFVRQDIGSFRQLSNFFLELDTSNRDFGGLGFLGIPFPENQSTAVEVTLISPDGRQIVQQFSSNPGDRVVPLIAGKAFDVAFDSITIGQVIQRNIETNSFVGQLYLPSIEFVTSGTEGNFNYGISLGTWFNLNRRWAGSVQNDLGLPEPDFGVYAGGLANLIFESVKLDQENRPFAIETQVPFISIDWNSSPNRLNTFQVVAGHNFSRRGIRSGYSATGAIAYIPQGSNGVNPENSNGELLLLLSGQLGTGWGLGFRANFEIGKDIFVDLELTQRVMNSFSLGVYYQNFNNINIGLNSRIDDDYYGVIVRYISPNGRINIDGKLGNSDNGFDASLKSTLRFHF
ncbi:MAG: hypothetical protein EA414_00875 [Arthrospira sp. PLM2.Bin9]|nr:hypothetical protein [Arthrospira sp. PLM2.Bin9]TVU55590.1 MAG: hypothetical protein EA414_00875 [Arthrospira sp. PLM2.Bin9]